MQKVQNGGSDTYDQELRAVEELESDARAVAGAKHFVLADGLDACRLAHSDGVDHGSVPETTNSNHSNLIRAANKGIETLMRKQVAQLSPR